ncbi:MAG: O-acetylhomoserine sulfhydrylase / O-succinylhomoserine sulfhydrylase, partial [uncultured Gemmatimonadetes bacterium]
AARGAAGGAGGRGGCHGAGERDGGDGVRAPLVPARGRPPGGDARHLRGHARAAGPGAVAPGDRHHLRGHDGGGVGARVPPRDARGARGVAVQSRAARAGPARHQRGGACARGAGDRGCHLRVAHQPAPAGARGGPGDAQRHQVPGRAQRRDGRGADRLRRAHGGGARAGPGVGAGARPARVLAAGARHQDAGAAHGAPQRQRDGRGALGGDGGGGGARALPRPPVAPGPRARAPRAGRLRRDDRDRGGGRERCGHALRGRAAPGQAGPVAGRRGDAGLRAAPHLARAHDARGACRERDPGRLHPHIPGDRGRGRPDRGLRAGAQRL